MPSYLDLLNNNKFFMGLAMLIVNVGSKYVQFNLSPGQEAALRKNLTREVLIFAMIFMGTRDLVISILMTAAFTILAGHVLNENSKMCVIPAPLRRLRAEADLNGDKIITNDEERRATEVLALAKKQRESAQQSGFVSYMQSNAFSSPYEAFI